MVVHSPEENGSRMASVVSIAGCFYGILPSPLGWDNLHLDYIADVLSMLTLRPDIQHRQCKDLNVLYSLLPENSRRYVSDALCGLCIHLAHNRNLKKPQWLYAIPLIHFLRKQSAPFDSPQLDPEKITWDDKQFGLVHVKSVTDNKNLW